MSRPLVIHWFRQDLRLADNPALLAAANAGQVLPLYIFDDVDAGDHKMGAASRWWLHHSLSSLNTELNGRLQCFAGDAREIIARLVSQYSTVAIYWNRCYEPWRVEQDREIREQLQSLGVAAASFNGSLLWEPWENLKSDGTPYKVFTPFYQRGCLGAPAPRAPLPCPPSLELAPPNGGTVSELQLLPANPWHKKLGQAWHVGEQAAQARLKTFVSEILKDYETGRDFPAQQSVSRLSPHLHFGEISPNQAWHAATAISGSNQETFHKELAWREFSYSLLFHFPALPDNNWQPKFDAFPWRQDDEALHRWQRGQTGIPVVDAGMRELWETGYMHNRIRMVVASFLVKNLLIHWREGARWFWDCLVDADLANNSASWQWVAGCGADAAPYFRIFNPVTQGEKFDPDGSYTRRFVPELASLPDKYLFRPWQAPADLLDEAGVSLGQTYPHPIADLKASRESALAAFKSLGT